MKNLLCIFAVLFSFTASAQDELFQIKWEGRTVKSATITFEEFEGKYNLVSKGEIKSFNLTAETGETLSVKEVYGSYSSNSKAGWCLLEGRKVTLIVPQPRLGLNFGYSQPIPQLVLRDGKWFWHTSFTHKGKEVAGCWPMDISGRIDLLLRVDGIHNNYVFPNLFKGVESKKYGRLSFWGVR